MRKTKIHIVSDFDGTLTGVAGEKLIFEERGGLSAFYRSLLENPAAIGASYTSKLMPQMALQTIMRQAFNKFEKEMGSRDPRRLTEEAKFYLQQMLKLEDVSITLVSKNQADYIKAMLALEGFSKAQIDKIEIVISSNKPRRTVVEEIVKQHDIKKGILQVRGYDDNEQGTNEMRAGFDAKNIHVIIDDKSKIHNTFTSKSCLPNSFEWDWIGEVGSVRKDLGLKPLVAEKDVQKLQKECDSYKRDLDKFISDEKMKCSDPKYKEKHEDRLVIAQQRRVALEQVMMDLKGEQDDVKKIYNSAKSFQSQIKVFQKQADPRTEKFIKAAKFIFGSMGIILTVGLAAVPILAYSLKNKGTGKFWESRDEQFARKINEAQKGMREPHSPSGGRKR